MTSHDPLQALLSFITPVSPTDATWNEGWGFYNELHPEVICFLAISIISTANTMPCRRCGTQAMTIGGNGIRRSETSCLSGNRPMEAGTIRSMMFMEPQWPV